MYGLERVGSLGNQRLIGGHDWYSEGARALLRKQNDDGSWSTSHGEKDSNTCFALMFLIRGSRSTGLAERPLADEEADFDAFDIATNQDNPLAAWVGELGEPVRRRLDGGAAVREVAWLVNGVEVAVVPQTSDNVLLDRFPISHELAFNGEHEVMAVMRFADAEGVDLGEERSAARRVRVDSVEEAKHREAVTDNRSDLIDAASVQATASTERGGHGAARAVDGRFGTSWLCTDADRRPTLSVRLRRPARASLLKLTAAQPYLGGEADWARPREIEVQINGGKAIRYTMLDNVRLKQHIAFPRTGVSRVRIRVLSVYPGATHPKAVGFREVELFDRPEGPIPGATPAFQDVRVIQAPSKDDGSEWRYTTAEPKTGWTHPRFDDAGWSTGKGAFGSLGADQGCRTEWSSSDLWCRRVIRLKRPPIGRLVLQVNADDLADVYLNGVLAARVDAWTRQTYRVFPPQRRPAGGDRRRPGHHRGACPEHRRRRVRGRRAERRPLSGPHTKSAKRYGSSKPLE